jgi:signal transduction histidine kinase
MSEFNFGEMVEEAVDTIEVLQPSFNLMVNGNGDFLVVADRYRLIQVIVNYLSNAIKYSNGNKEVTLSISTNNHSVTVFVKDGGLGISKEHLPYVFERFFRIQKTRNIEGIGLGLYLCSRIIHAHKGHLWAESEEGKGSTFYFSIPLKPELAAI